MSNAIKLPLLTGAGLAPMAGVTDAAMRLLCREQGAAWSVSEMLSAKGWVFSGGREPRHAGSGPNHLHMSLRGRSVLANLRLSHTV